MLSHNENTKFHKIFKNYKVSSQKKTPKNKIKQKQNKLKQNKTNKARSDYFLKK